MPRRLRCWAMRFTIPPAISAFYKTWDPKGGKWDDLGKPFDVGDPDPFADDDGRVYLYYGLSYNGGISGMELDPKNQFRPIGTPFQCFRANYAQSGGATTAIANLIRLSIIRCFSMNL